MKSPPNRPFMPAAARSQPVSIYGLPSDPVAVRDSFRFAKLRHQFFSKVARGNCALLDEQKMKSLGRESISQQFCGFVAQRVDLILAEPVSDSLSRPFRISKNRRLG